MLLSAFRLVVLSLEKNIPTVWVENFRKQGKKLLLGLAAVRKRTRKVPPLNVCNENTISLKYFIHLKEKSPNLGDISIPEWLIFSSPFQLHFSTEKKARAQKAVRKMQESERKKQNKTRTQIKQRNPKQPIKTTTKTWTVTLYTLCYDILWWLWVLPNL